MCIKCGMILPMAGPRYEKSDNTLRYHCSNCGYEASEPAKDSHLQPQQDSAYKIAAQRYLDNIKKRREQG